MIKEEKDETYRKTNFGVHADRGDDDRNAFGWRCCRR